MKLYEIIKSLQAASGSNAKQAILEANRTDKLLQYYLWATYDPALSYYITKLPDVKGWTGNQEFDVMDIDWVVTNLAKRTVTGHEAVACFGGHLSALNQESIELMGLLIKRSVGAGVGDTMILKTWPNLYFLPPYQRCSLMDDKIKAKFEKLPVMYVQPKLDGSFMYLVKESGKPPEAITRAGSKYPQWFADKLAEGLPDDYVLIGEALVIDKGVTLDRQTGNGILNSILKSSENEYKHLEFTLTAWDMINPEEFKAGKSSVTYHNRLRMLFSMYDHCEPKSVEVIKNKAVANLKDAYSLYSSFTAQGLEGAVLKNPDSLWKDGTSKDCIKLKTEFVIDLLITAVKEGTGKAAGMLGAVSVQSREGIIACDVGTGFSDAQRKEYWENPPIGDIMSVKANDIIGNRNDQFKSLFLPVHLEVRADKKVADSYEHCVAQLNAARN